MSSAGSVSLLINEVRQLQAAGCDQQDLDNLDLALGSGDPEARLAEFYAAKSNTNLALYTIPGAGFLAPVIEAFNLLGQFGVGGGLNELEALAGLGALVVASAGATLRIRQRSVTLDRKHRALLKVVQHVRRRRRTQ